LIAIAALAAFVGLAPIAVSRALAQNGEAPEAVQSAQDADDAAQAAIDDATEKRDELESDGAPQDQIDAANAAIAQARADKAAADEALENANNAAGEAPDQANGN
jgi:hypothetical protein